MKRQSLLAILVSALACTGAWSGNFTVGVEGQDYLPISKGEGGTYSGYARDVLDAFASRYGHTFTYRPLPVTRLLDEFVVQKSVDLKFPDNVHWESDKKGGAAIVYSKGLLSVTEGLFVLPANKGKPVAKIATLRGFTPFPYMEGIKSKKITVSEANTADAVISMIEAGRADGAYLSAISCTYIMNEVMKKPGVLVFDDKQPSSANDFSISSISHPEVIKQMDEFLVKEKDTVAKIKAKYKITE